MVEKPGTTFTVSDFPPPQGTDIWLAAHNCLNQNLGILGLKDECKYTNVCTIIYNNEINPMSLKQRISILGCGWLGMSLALALVQKGYEVKGSTRSDAKSEALKLSGVLPFVVDLNKENNELSDFLQTDVLIIAVTSKQVEDFRNLIQQIGKSTVSKVLFVSSTSVYPNSNSVVTETSDVINSALTQIESLFRSNNAFKTTILRFGGLYGYDRQPGRFFPAGKKIEQPEGFVNFIHRDDCIGILSQIIEQNLWQETLNACADTHPTRRVFYTNEALKLGLPEPEFIESSVIAYKIISSEKLKKLLDYSFLFLDLMRHEED